MFLSRQFEGMPRYAPKLDPILDFQPLCHPPHSLRRLSSAIFDKCSSLITTPAPAIVEVENGYNWKVSTIGETHFCSDPWLWEEGYTSPIDKLIADFCNFLHPTIEISSPNSQEKMLGNPSEPLRINHIYTLYSGLTIEAPKSPFWKWPFSLFKKKNRPL